MVAIKLPRVSGNEVVRALERVGFRKASQKGSHVKMRHPDGQSAIVPLHHELKLGTLRSIQRQARMELEDFLALLR